MKIFRKARRALRGASALASGYYGSLLAKLSPRRHLNYTRGKVRGPYRGALTDQLASAMRDLGRNHDQLAAMTTASDAIRGAIEQGEFDRWIPDHIEAEDKATLIECADFLPGQSWKLQLFYIPEGQSHPPHSHSDVTSCLVVVDGRLQAREYDRHHELERQEDQASLSLASDKSLKRGDALLTTRSKNDVHWFGAVGGPAVACNFQAVGFVRGRKFNERRRVYVDPTGVPRSGIGQAPLLDSKEAKRRFSGRLLSDFPLSP